MLPLMGKGLKLEIEEWTEEENVKWNLTVKAAIAVRHQQAVSLPA